MKAILALTLLIAVSAQAEAQSLKTIETIFTCEQDDGDQWIEVGIALNDGPGLRAYVVAHDEDYKTKALVANRQVFEKKSAEKTVYEDPDHTLRLVVVNASSQVRGDLMVLQDKGPGINETGLLCIENESISFDLKE